MSGDGAGLQATVAELRRIGREMHALTEKEPSGWQRQYLALRRGLIDQIVQASNRSAELSSSHPSPPLVADFRKQLGTLRHILAEHQEHWPVVTLPPTDLAYRQSIATIATVLKELDAIADKIDRA